MGCRPQLDINVVKRLKQINPRLSTQWNIKRNRWDILFTPCGRTPYILMSVGDWSGRYRPIDNRDFNHLRWLFWIHNNHGGLKHYLARQLDIDEENEEKVERAIEDKFRQISKEARRPIQMLGRQLGVLSGKAKIPTIQGANIH